MNLHVEWYGVVIDLIEQVIELIHIEFDVAAENIFEICF